MFRTTVPAPPCTALVWLSGLVMSGLVANTPRARAQPSEASAPKSPTSSQAQDTAPPQQAPADAAQTPPPAKPAPEPSSAPKSPSAQAPKDAAPIIPPGLTQNPQNTPPTETQKKEPKRPLDPKLDPSISPEEIRQRVWNDRYRPREDPFRFQGVMRAGMFAGGKSKQTRGGRGLGLEIEAGVSKNYWSIAAAFGGQFGNFYRAPLAPLPLHPEITPLLRATHPGYRTAANFSTGLRAGIGRLALQGYGFIEPRLGYDLSWSIISPIAGARAEKVAMGHGPALRIDAGFLSISHRAEPKFRRVFGASLGWNMTVGGIDFDLPTTHYVFVGIFAQMN